MLKGVLFLGYISLPGGNRQNEGMYVKYMPLFLFLATHKFSKSRYQITKFWWYFKFRPLHSISGGGGGLSIIALPLGSRVNTDPTCTPQAKEQQNYASLNNTESYPRGIYLYFLM